MWYCMFCVQEYSPQTIISERDAAIIVQELDDNRSGRIEFSDFISLMTRPNIFKKVLLRKQISFAGVCDAFVIIC